MAQRANFTKKEGKMKEGDKVKVFSNDMWNGAQGVIVKKREGHSNYPGDNWFQVNVTEHPR